VTVYKRYGTKAQQRAATELRDRVAAAEVEAAEAYRWEMALLQLRLQAAEQARTDARLLRLRRRVAVAESAARTAEQEAEEAGARMAEAEAVRVWALRRWPESVDLGPRRADAAVADAAAFGRAHAGTPRSRAMTLRGSRMPTHSQTVTVIDSDGYSVAVGAHPERRTQTLQAEELAS